MHSMNKEEVTVSVVTVVKNEAHNIGAFLDSIDGFADELVLVDTGSTDTTLDLLRARMPALSFKVQLHEGLRLNPYHHGKAKNYSIERGTCDYIFILDADERLSEALKKNLKRFLSEKRPVLVAMQRQDELVPHLLDPQQRVLLRDAHIRYKEDGGAIVHCEFKNAVDPVRFEYPIYHLQGENHWLRHPTRFMGQMRLEALGAHNTRGLLREMYRGINGFYYKFKRIYKDKQAYKDGWNGFAYAFLKSTYSVLLHVLIGLKPREKTTTN